MRNLSYENEFYSQVHSNANHTHFHMKDFALGLGLKQRQKATRKWPIKIGGMLFFYEVEGHMQTLSSFGQVKKYGLKSHLG